MTSADTLLSPVIPPQVAPPKVLVVDDEPALQQAIKLALKNEGYELYFAGNGRDGMELFRKYNPDLIFLDLRMPIMDGYQFLEAITVTPDALFTVIAITGHGVDREIERCYRLGVDFFLKKPVSMVEICCIARRCIEEKRLKAERERLIASLQHAQETIKHLKSFLVICSSCRRVRDSEEQWQELDAYIRTHTSTRFSHGLCPECIHDLYPDISDKVLKRMK
ncbi:MAG: response regulator [Desulfobulbaceae bacterium]